MFHSQLCKWLFSVGIAVALMPVTVGETAQAAQGVQFQKVYGVVPAPTGHVDLCARRPTLCRANNAQRQRITLNAATWNDLVEINAAVNGAIMAASDQQMHGVVERWDVAEHAGDCEDYALLKQRLLMARGWPQDALLLTVVLDENGGGHAVLVVRTTEGDFVLDNRMDRVELWNSLPYRFVKRQSFQDPRVWVALDPAFARQARVASASLSNVWTAAQDR